MNLDATIDAAERAELEHTWAHARGVWGWIGEVNHTVIGKRFIATAFVFFGLAGILSLLMRLQLAAPEATWIGPDRYNQIFSVHGSTMMFLFAVPVMEGFGVLLVPLMVGTRNMAFPRLSSFSYWTYVVGGVLLYVGLVLDIGPDAGWFAYVPLSGPDNSPGKRIDLWAQMVTFTELSAIAGAVNVVATILKQRAPGMSIDRMPLFVWAQLVKAVMVLFAMPAVMLASLCLALDRLIGTQFFNPVTGGDPLLYQHLFWFFGHPEVYIIFIPALGMISMILSSATQREVFGTTAVIVSLVATGFIGFGLWVHHMFATGLPQRGESFFTAASILIALPSGTQIFCWLATIWGSRPRWTVAFAFVLAFFALFVLGGLSGVMLASVPIDLQVHDTYFVVAHFHYVLIGGAVFPLFGAVYHWFPKMTGRRLSERLGWTHLGLFFVGFNLTFFPMHRLGLLGMPRRVYTYLPERGWGSLNFVASVGAVVMGVAVLVFLANVAWSRRFGLVAGADPWAGPTLEWAIPSPVPSYGFARLPVVASASPLWGPSGAIGIVTGVRSDRPEVLVTNLLDATPNHRTELPGPSPWPFLVALSTGVTFIGSIFTPWGLPVGAACSLVTLTGWFWPKAPHRVEEMVELHP